MGWGCIENLQNNQGTDTFGTVFRARNPETGMLDGDDIPVDFAKIAEATVLKDIRFALRTNSGQHLRTPKSRRKQFCSI